MLNVLVPEVGLQRSRIDAVIGQFEAAGVPQHMGMNRETEAGELTGTLDQLGEADVENGEPRSDVNTNADFGSCSRCNFRSTLISSPMIGWFAGDPFLARLTCRVALSKSI